ncbi:MAG: DUF177 domain-containing protein [Clostridia bacterium]|nr:DUF177 domain-containing protein [Clostridia bacterium]
MMIIDIRKLNAQKKYFGSMEFDYEAPETLIGIPYVKFASPVKVELEYDLYEDDSLEVKGKISYRLEGQCSRCLKETAQDVEGELDAFFEPKKDSEDYSYTNGVVDLTKAVEDAIMLSLPFGLYCAEECESERYSQ